MPGVFINLTDKDIFKSGGRAQHLVRIPKVDEIVSSTSGGNQGAALYNNVSMQLGETMQFFLTFDDVIKFIHFGKALGSVTVEGTIFCDCQNNLPKLKQLAKAITALRGKEQTILLGEGGIISMTAVMTSVQLSIVGDPSTMANFVFNFAVVDHLL
jgi:hypothetical protein